MGSVGNRKASSFGRENTGKRREAIGLVQKRPATSVFACARVAVGGRDRDPDTGLYIDNNLLKLKWRPKRVRYTGGHRGR